MSETPCWTAIARVCNAGQRRGVATTMMRLSRSRFAVPWAATSDCPSQRFFLTAFPFPGATAGSSGSTLFRIRRPDPWVYL